MPGMAPCAVTCAMRVTSSDRSFGDIAPYTGLGQGLAGRGHVVTIATHDRFRYWISQRWSEALLATDGSRVAGADALARGQDQAQLDRVDARASKPL